MENSISIIKELNIHEINKGKIIKRDRKYYIVMERHLHTFPDKRVIGKYIKKPEDEFHYKIYDFMEADYEIYDDKYPEGFTGGTQYYKKTGYTLKEFYEEYKKTSTV